MVCLFTIRCFGQTQLEINQRAYAVFLKSDRKLNSVYQAVLTKHKSDKEFTKNLRIAQSTWIRFRDAQMKVMYPDRNSTYYGSIQPLCWNTYLKN